jgi:hypothetical protein
MNVTSGFNENEYDSAEHEKVVSPETASACEPGCSCGHPVKVTINQVSNLFGSYGGSCRHSGLQDN